MYDQRECRCDIRVHRHDRSDLPWVFVDFGYPMKLRYVSSVVVLFQEFLDLWSDPESDVRCALCNIPNSATDVQTVGLEVADE